VVLGKNVDTNVVAINENMSSSVNSVDISKMDYFEIFYVKDSDISQMDYFVIYNKSCVKSSNFSNYEQCIKESCNTNVDKSTVDCMHCFSVPVYDTVEGCNLAGFRFQPHTNIHTYASPSGARVRDVQDLLDHGEVLRQGRVFNFQQKIKSLDTHINVDRLRELTEYYYDKQVIDLIEFGFPLDMDKSNFKASNLVENQPSATNFMDSVLKYIQDEINEKAILGPFDQLPHHNVHISPLMTRPKEGTKHRVIVDLSYPYEYGRSVNSVTSAEIYLQTAYSLKLPTIDTICDLINNVGGPVKLFKVDLACAFRQLKIDPADIFNLGLKVEGKYYLDASLPFGWWSGFLIIFWVIRNHILLTKLYGS
jgi:hypothetical protein